MKRSKNSALAGAVGFDAHLAESHHAGIAHRGVAFELAIGKDLSHLGDLEGDARVLPDILLEVAGGGWWCGDRSCPRHRRTDWAPHKAGRPVPTVPKCAEAGAAEQILDLGRGSSPCPCGGRRPGSSPPFMPRAPGTSDRCRRALPSNGCAAASPWRRACPRPSSFCGAPSGLDLSKRNSPLNPTAPATSLASSEIVTSSPQPTLTWLSPV